MSKWAEIRNNFCNEEDGKVFVDAWETDADDEEGTVIAKVDYKTKEIEYLDDDAENDEYAQEIIKEILDSIDNGNYQNCE